MAITLRPHRGKKSTMAGDKASIILSAGELFMEYPDTGVGTGNIRFKVGDGTSTYDELPYATPNIFTIQKNGVTVQPDANGTVNIVLDNGVSDIDGLQDALDAKLDKTANAVSASKWSTARTITLGGDASGSVSMDGSANVILNVTVKDDSHSHTIDNVDGLQDALDGKLSTTGTAAAATKLATARTISLTGGATGSTTFDGTGNASIAVTVADDSHNHTITNVDGLQDALDGKSSTSHNHALSNLTGSLDASRLTGTIDIARLPAAALERCVVVEDDTARFALTTTDIQLGDTVKVTETNKMYMVIDTAELDNEAGYTAYTAGSASEVPWSGVTGKPSTFPPSTHTHNYAGSSSAGGAANSAVKLATARTITLGGDASGSVSFDGSSNVTLNVNVVDDSHNHTIANVDGLQDALDGKLASGGTAAAANKLATARTITLTGDATGSTTFDGSANVSIAVTVTDASHAHTIANVDGLQTALNGKLSTTGTAAAATKLATARTISLSGDATGSTSFDGSGNATIDVTIGNVNNKITSIDCGDEG